MPSPLDAPISGPLTGAILLIDPVLAVALHQAVAVVVAAAVLRVVGEDTRNGEGRG